MKKYAMLTVKGAVGLVPKSIRAKLKKNAKLTALYSRSLHKSGLFYGLPSKKKSLALYKQFLKWQTQTLNSKVIALKENEETLAHSLRVVVLGKDGVHKTLDSLRACRSSLTVCVIAEELASDVFEEVTWLNVKVFTSFSDLPLQSEACVGTLLVNSGDTLHPHAMALFADALKHSDIVYSDTDTMDSNGQCQSPRFFPQWNADLHFSTAYVNTGMAVSQKVFHRNRPLLTKASTVDIAQLLSLLWIKDNFLKITHLSFTLVHTSPTRREQAKYISQVADVINNSGCAVAVTDENKGINQLMWPAKEQPLVSLIIPTKNAWQLVKACIDSILEKTRYENYEILLIDNGSDEPESLAYFNRLTNHPRIRVLCYPAPFNYSAINNFGVKHASGEVIGLINNDIEVISGDWLTYMVGHAQREDIGCVGARLYYSDDRVQHAGVVMGYGGGAGHAHKYFPRYHSGYLKRLVATHQYSAVTAACLLVKRSLYEAVGGLNESLAVAFNDVDFCLRVREQGVANLFCAEAELYHHESVSRGLDTEPEKAARFNRELNYLQTTWHKVIAADPAYSPNLTLKRENFSIKEKSEYIDS